YLDAIVSRALLHIHAASELGHRPHSMWYGADTLLDSQAWSLGTHRWAHFADSFVARRYDDDRDPIVLVDFRNLIERVAVTVVKKHRTIIPAEIHVLQHVLVLLVTLRIRTEHFTKCTFMERGAGV